ncbi:hypothetical protein ABCW43_11330 [Neorhizobium sp. IRAMC:178]|uniref:hypothetical protein n=1 Tax=Neorhizobium tunisiense TaxID=3144793 RepID=UPI0031F6C06A
MQTDPRLETIDFPSLALDAAIQLDHLEKHKDADLEVISTFGKYLASPSGNAPTAGLFALSENPVNVEILNSAFYSVEGTASTNMKELEGKLKTLVKSVSDVGSGASADESVVAALKRFCLSLHRVLLDDLAPAADDEWMPIHDARFA